MKRIEKWTPVSATWLDAWTDYTEGASKDFEREYKRAIRKTIGWLIFKDKDRIVVAMEDDRLHGDGSDCQTVTTIPAPMVQDVQVFRAIPAAIRPRRRKAA